MRGTLLLCDTSNDLITQQSLADVSHPLLVMFRYCSSVGAWKHCGRSCFTISLASELLCCDTTDTDCSLCSVTAS